MKFKSLIIALVGICIVNEALATINLCGNNEEKDVCETCNRQRKITAPRPHPIQVPRLPLPQIRTICRQETIQGPKPFDPIGDVCNCGKQVVKPAPLPNIRPSCLPSLPRINFHQPSCSCSACSENSPPETSDCGKPVRAPEEYQIYNNKGATIYLDKPKSKPQHTPKPYHGQADVVSVAIARQLANKAKNSISEKQIQYGALKEPTIPEQESKRIINSINEESFFDTKGEILEIKSNLFERKHVISSESESSEEEQKPSKIPEDFRPAQLKYDEIGYALYQPSSEPRYVVVKNSQKANHDCTKSTTRRPHRHHHSRHQSSCGCRSNLLVEQNGNSEQSLSYENNSDQYVYRRGRLST